MKLPLKNSARRAHDRKPQAFGVTTGRVNRTGVRPQGACETACSIAKQACDALGGGVLCDIGYMGCMALC